MKNKKETSLSVLKEIRDILKAHFQPIQVENSKAVTVTFPQKTAKEMIDEVENTIDGYKLVWSGWMLNEDFYKKELPRKESAVVDLEISNKYKSWDECAALGPMLNFPEFIYLLINNETFRKNSWDWTWLSSRSSGGRLVDVGRFGGSGLLVGSAGPGDRYGFLGVRFARS